MRGRVRDRVARMQISRRCRKTLVVQDGTERIGFNLNASRSDWVTAVGIGRIQDKTRWTKAVGEAVTFVYGDCTGGIGQSRT
jgi:hypothetical protein